MREGLRYVQTPYWSAVSQLSIKSVNNKAYHELKLLNLVKILIVCIYDQRRRAHGSGGVNCPRCPNSTGGSMRGKRGCPFLQELHFKTRVLLRTVFLSNLVQVLTTCNKMNIKSANIRSISQYTKVCFILSTNEKRTISLQKFC